MTFLEAAKLACHNMWFPQLLLGPAIMTTVVWIGATLLLWIGWIK